MVVLGVISVTFTWRQGTIRRSLVVFPPSCKSLCIEKCPKLSQNPLRKSSADEAVTVGRLLSVVILSESATVVGRLASPHIHRRWPSAKTSLQPRRKCHNAFLRIMEDTTGIATTVSDSQLTLYARQMLTRRRLRRYVCSGSLPCDILSVCMSVKRVDCDKTRLSVNIWTPYDRAMFIVSSG